MRFMTLWFIFNSCIYFAISKSLPNILFILIDDLGYNDVSYHNGCDYQTPNIDELAAHSLKLSNYYIQHICTPTRSAFLSGLYPIHTGLQDGVIQTISPYGLPLDLTLLPNDLKRAGYDTHIIGKWHCGFFEPRYVPTARGFDTYFGYYSGAETYFYHNATDAGVHGYDFRNGTNPIIINGNYSTWLYGNETIRILKQYENNINPFFIYLPFQAVHGPLQAPQYVIDSLNKTIANLNRRKLAAMTIILDDVIGQIINFIKNDTNLWDNLMIVFSTDNGGPVPTNASNFPLRGSKTTLWEGGVKGVGFISGGWLNNTQRGKEMNALMHITDWYPTIMDMIDMKATNESLLDGYSQLNNIQFKDVNDNTSIYIPRSEILHNIDPVNCKTIICGSLRMNDYKILIGREVDNKNNLCLSGWCPLDDMNESQTTIQCEKGKSNYDYPIINETYIHNHCPYNNQFCMFNIMQDHCEWYDIKDEHESLFQQMYDRLLYYNSTMVTPLNTLYPPNATAANPAHWGGFWSPWINHTNFTNNIGNQTNVQQANL